jgi:hypothetical protein
MDTQSQLSTQQQNLISQVQYNCDISDANHAGNYTLCIYLLKMREYYRWMNALEFCDDFAADSMTQWLRERESSWESVMDEPFRDIQLNESRYDPFDSGAINSSIKQQQLFYHAGIGQKAVQHFFIAELVEQRLQDGVRISVTGREYARDLTAPPAISTQSEIIVRQESLKRMCWERYQEWNWNRLDNPMGTALSFYPFEQDIPAALDSMVKVEQNTLIKHEQGEMQISQAVGEQWSHMMLKLLGSKAELLARSVRDHLADCLHTLPFLLEQQNPASIHFYFANLTQLRKELFPTAMQAYRKWAQTEDIRPLVDLPQRAAKHWDKTLHAILAIETRTEHNPASEIVQLIERSKY